MNMTRRSFLGACLAAVGIGWELLHGRIPEKEENLGFLCQRLSDRADERLSLVIHRPQSFASVHPMDWQTVRLMKNPGDDYIWGPPEEVGPEYLWGKRVIKS